MENETVKTIIIFLITMALIFSTVLSYNANNEKDLMITIMKTDLIFSEAGSISSQGNTYYDLASISYEREENSNVEYYCTLARDEFSDATQKFREAKTPLKEINKPISEVYIDLIDSAIEIDNNMFEACENFESASREYDAGDFDMGGVYIDAMNLKIADHDKAVNEYNDLLEDYRFELNQLL